MSALGLEHLEARGIMDGWWPDAALQHLVEREMPLTPTLAVTNAAIPPDTASKLRERAAEFHGAGRGVAGCHQRSG